VREDRPAVSLPLRVFRMDGAPRQGRKRETATRRDRRTASGGSHSGRTAAGGADADRRAGDANLRRGDTGGERACGGRTKLPERRPFSLGKDSGTGRAARRSGARSDRLRDSRQGDAHRLGEQGERALRGESLTREGRRRAWTPA